MSARGHVSRARLEGPGAAQVRRKQRQEERDIDEDVLEVRIECFCERSIAYSPTLRPMRTEPVSPEPRACMPVGQQELYSSIPLKIGLLNPKN